MNQILGENIRCCSGGYSRLTSEYNDTIGEISCHDEIVFDDERSALCVQDISER